MTAFLQLFHLMLDNLTEIEKKCASIRHKIAHICFRANAGHVGASLSALEIMTVVRYLLTSDDHFILSKGHAAALLYSTLSEFGDISDDELQSFYKNGTKLPAHPAPNSLQNVPFATGSLGHGLSLACGLALGKKLANKPGTIYCICSDGEFNEGSTWEALLFATQHQLNNLVCLIDRNHIQGFGFTEEVMKLEPLQQKLVAFGANVKTCNGHSLNDIIQTMNTTSDIQNSPRFIICETIKGRGIEGIENTVACHYLPLTENQYKSLLDSKGD